MLTAACLLIINPVTAENSDARPAWKDSLYGSSSFSFFLVGEKSARRPWWLRRRGGRACVGSSRGSEQVVDEEVGCCIEQVRLRAAPR